MKTLATILLIAAAGALFGCSKLGYIDDFSVLTPW